MSNKTLQKESEKARKSSTLNHLNAKTPGANRSTRSRAPLVRKCCACQATNDSYKTDQKSPQKSSGVANKTTTTNSSSVNQRKRFPSIDSSSVSRKVNSAQVVQNGCRNDSKATTPVSACTSPVVRQKATNVAKNQVKGEQKLEQINQQPTSIRKPTKTPEKTESKVATPRKNLIKQFESAAIAGSSKQSDKKKINSSPLSKLNKSSSFSKPLHNKELKERPSVKEVPKKKAENNASKGKLKVSSDVQSVNTESDCSSDSEDDDDLHITWDGFEEDYIVGENCCLCDNDLSVRPLKEDGHESEFSTLPVSAVLPCGHVFHRDCLEVVEGDYPIPLCIFCESMSS